MKKHMILILLMVGMASMVMAKPPAARITTKEITVAAGVTTNTVKTFWLNTGDDTAVITADGTIKIGAGAIRAAMYRVSGSISNCTATFYTYDAGVKNTLCAFTPATTTVVTSGYGRYDFPLSATNAIYSGRLWVDVSDSRTNSLDTWIFSAIVE
jgi:hypothetical protein